MGGDWTNRRRLGAVASALLVSACLGGTPTAAHATTTRVFYVDAGRGSDTASGLVPGAAFLTIARAQQAVRTALRASRGPIEVNLMPGTFEITEPLQFGPADSGADGAVVTWRAADAAAPPVLSAARDIKPAAGTKWAYNPALRVWSLAGVTHLATRDLWVNGHRASRVHSCIGTEPCGLNNSFNPSTLSLTSNGSGSGKHPPNPNLPDYSESLAGKVRTYRNAAGVEFVYRFDGTPGQTGVPWAEPRCDIASVTATVITMEPCFVTGREENPGTAFQMDLPSGVENAYELFDAAAHGDQWYWDPATSTLFYQAEDGTLPGYGHGSERFAPPSSVIAGAGNTTILAVDGASHLAFSGIDFAYTTWTTPSGPSGMVDSQTGLPQAYCGADCTYAVVPPAAVTAANATNLDFSGDTFEHLGAGGIRLGSHVAASTIESSTFRDIGDNAVMIGEVARPTSPLPVNAGDTVRGNRFTNSADVGDPSFAVGAQYHSGVAIWAGYTSGLQVLNNSLCNVTHPTPCRMPSDGIAVGWGWGVSPPTHSVGHNVIAGNAVVNSMQWLWDGGAIYSLGVQPEELIRANVVVGAPHTPGAIYIDEGGTNVTVLDNVIEAVRNDKNPFGSAAGPRDQPAGGLYVHTCSSGVVRVLDLFYDATPSPPVQNSAGGCSQQANVTLRGGFGGLPDTAMPASILAGAGFEPGAVATAPSAPGNATGSAAGPLGQSLTWSASTALVGSVTGYEVQQADPTYGTVVVAASQVTHVIAADPTLQPAYTDTIYARDSSGTLSPPSAPVIVAG
ncbi:MAG: right-handed parallel beta-helix repeat-containing protein [Acidimicrobiales bacterium]